MYSHMLQQRSKHFSTVEPVVVTAAAVATKQRKNKAK